MSIRFFQTVMGRTFFERDVPSILRQLSDLNANLREIVTLGRELLASRGSRMSADTSPSSSTGAAVEAP